MLIQINDERKISEVQLDFNELFPFLKIEFFKGYHNIGAASSRKQMLPSNHRLKEIRKENTVGELVLNPEMTVADLEQTFYKKFGLSVQVFRKSGKVWLETTATDDWTLEHQNAQGKELSEFYKNR